MKIRPFKASFPNPDLVSSPDSFFDRVSAEYINLRASGFFKYTEENNIYVYRISGKNTALSILASNDLSDVDDRKILGHEKTLTENEQDMMQLLLLRKAMIKPVLLAYPDQKAISKWMVEITKASQPFLSFRMEKTNELHEFWAVSGDAQIKHISQMFQKLVPKSYIADGHHRIAVSNKLIHKNYLGHQSEQNGVLCAYFPLSHLYIHDYNRVVSLPPHMSYIKWIASISKYLKLKPIPKAAKPSHKHSMTLVIDKEWYLCTWRKKYIVALEGNKPILDVDLFNHFLLEQALAIPDIKLAQNIQYVSGIAGTNGLENTTQKSPNSVGFCLYPISREEVLATAEAHEYLPPKSTWFEPRLRNGMLILDF